MKKTDNYSNFQIELECHDYYDKALSLVHFNQQKGKFLNSYYTALDTAEGMLKNGHTLKTITDYLSETYNTSAAKQTLAMLMQKHPLLVAEVFLNGDEQDVEILDSGIFDRKLGLDANREAVKKYFEQ